MTYLFMCWSRLLYHRSFLRLVYIETGGASSRDPEESSYLPSPLLRAELYAKGGAGQHAYGLKTLIPAVFAGVAFLGNSAALAERHCPVGAVPQTGSAAYAPSVVMLSSSVAVFVHGACRAGLTQAASSQWLHAP